MTSHTRKRETYSTIPIDIRSKSFKKVWLEAMVIDLIMLSKMRIIVYMNSCS